MKNHLGQVSTSSQGRVSKSQNKEVEDSAQQHTSPHQGTQCKWRPRQHSSYSHVRTCEDTGSVQCSSYARVCAHISAWAFRMQFTFLCAHVSTWTVQSVVHTRVCAHEYTDDTESVVHIHMCAHVSTWTMFIMGRDPMVNRDYLWRKEQDFDD